MAQTGSRTLRSLEWNLFLANLRKLAAIAEGAAVADDCVQVCSPGCGDRSHPGSDLGLKRLFVFPRIARVHVDLTPSCSSTEYFNDPLDAPYPRQATRASEPHARMTENVV
jgi:hypothetical protein